MPITNPQSKVTVSFDFPREAWENENGIVDAFCGQYHYQERIPSEDETRLGYLLDATDYPGGSIPNPESKSQFTRNRVMDYVNEIWRAHNKTSNLALAAQQIDAELDVTQKIVRENTSSKVT